MGCEATVRMGEALRCCCTCSLSTDIINDISVALLFAVAREEEEAVKEVDNHLCDLIQSRQDS